MEPSLETLASDLHRLEGRVEDMAIKQTEQGTQIAVIAARQQTITDIHDNVKALVLYVIGTNENPGLIHEFKVLQTFESREHGAIAVVIFLVGIVGGVIAKSLIS